MGPRKETVVGPRGCRRGRGSRVRCAEAGAEVGAVVAGGCSDTRSVAAAPSAGCYRRSERGHSPGSDSIADIRPEINIRCLNKYELIHSVKVKDYRSNNNKAM